MPKIEIVCPLCHKKRVLKKPEALKLKRKGLCFRCYLLEQAREHNPNWKGGRIKNGDGYVLILMREHPHAWQHGYIGESRLVMEKVLGRYLLPNEQVHHRNGIKDDNRPENLVLFPDNGKHKSFHLKTTQRIEHGKFTKSQIS